MRIERNTPPEWEDEEVTRVLRDVSASRRDEARIILGAAVVDDVLALGVIGVLTVWATSGGAAIASQGVSTAGLVPGIAKLGARLARATGWLACASMSVWRWLSAIIDLLQAWRRIAAERRYLAGLSDYHLRDLGLSRTDLEEAPPPVSWFR